MGAACAAKKPKLGEEKPPSAAEVSEELPSPDLSLSGVPLPPYSEPPVEGGVGAAAAAGQLYVSGGNDDGRLGLDHKNNVVKFEPSLLTVPVAVVSCGDYHTVVVRGDDRSLLVAGSNCEGRLGLGHTDDVH